MTNPATSSIFEVSDQEFLELHVSEQVAVLLRSSLSDQRARMRLLALDDAADVVQAAPEEARTPLIDLLDAVGKREVTALRG
jgi:hypothetical protein